MKMDNRLTQAGELLARIGEVQELSKTSDSMSFVALRVAADIRARAIYTCARSFDNFNVLVFPAPQTDAPVLAIEIAFEGESIRFGALDLWLDVSGDFESSLGAAREVLSTAPVPSRLKGFFSDDAIFLEGGQSVEPVVEESLKCLEIYVETLVKAPAHDTPIEHAEAQKRLVLQLAGRPGGKDYLEPLFGEETQKIIDEVYFPAPRIQSGG